jgi:hypothetical protein
MKRLSSATAAAIAAALLVASATTAFAQATERKTSILTFSGPVQVPGRTLPAGTYVIEAATPATDIVWRIMDEHRQHVLAYMFYRQWRRTWNQAAAGNDKPLIELYETPAGTPPALRMIYYPGDTWGYEFAYPLEQAKQLATLTHQAVLATNSNAQTTNVPKLVFALPDGVINEPQPVGTTGGSDDSAAVPVP